MTHDVKQHPLNIIGDFYVEDGCCTLCDVPRTQAPELFATTDNEDHCFVKRQPQTDDETNQMMSAIAGAEFQCIRYRGDDPAIISRLSAMGEMDICDSMPPRGTEIGLRIHVTFATTQSSDLQELALSFKTHLKTQRSEYSRISFPWRWRSGKSATIEYKHNDEGWHLVRFGRHNSFVHVYHESHKARGVSWYINQWIATLDGVTDIRWYTDDGFRKTGVWHGSYW